MNWPKILQGLAVGVLCGAAFYVLGGAADIVIPGSSAGVFAVAGFAGGFAYEFVKPEPK
jgi:hypothetical protein